MIPVIILARGGSKGITGKNLVDFCGRPLLAWTIDFARRSSLDVGVWVSTDDRDIADLALTCGASVISRPQELARDDSPSEAGWLHAVDVIAAEGHNVDVIAALQPTSPLRRPEDLAGALVQYREEKLDSLFSGSRLEDLTLWEVSTDQSLRAVNHDPRRRAARQASPTPIVENGSIYLMRSSLLRSSGSRFTGRVGYFANESWQAFEIDSLSDLRVCEVLMKSFVLECDS